MSLLPSPESCFRRQSGALYFHSAFHVTCNRFAKAGKRYYPYLADGLADTHTHRGGDLPPVWQQWFCGRVGRKVQMSQVITALISCQMIVLSLSRHRQAWETSPKELSAISISCIIFHWKHFFTIRTPSSDCCSCSHATCQHSQIMPC